MAPNSRMIGGISKDTFVQADSQTRAALLFDILSHMSDKMCHQPELCQSQQEACMRKMAEVERRVEKIQESHNSELKKNSVLAGITGFFGGAAAMIVKLLSLGD